MKRRKFIKQTTVLSAGLLITKNLMAKNDSPVYGHGNMRYRMDKEWSKADPLKNPVNDCHEMVQDSKGRILLLTNETKNNVLIFNKSGRLLDTWGH
ncbi:MAG: 6-bladed beta-propeller, partial [Bacteroidota bacterium]|nr:6-bladed beta-propeller [Bacteroidota bacterium]